MSISPAQATTYTAQAFLTALVTNAGLLAVQVVAFVILKQRLGRIYSPRTFLPPPNKRAKELPKGPWKWVPAIIMAPTETIINDNGLDAYMFLRFLKMLIIIFLVFTIATFAIIIPIDAIDVNNGGTGLHQFNWENLTMSSDQNRFSAHIILAYLLTFFVIFMIRREMMHFVLMQQRFLISKSHSRLAQARTVLITSVPHDLANEEDMRLFTSFVPGGIDRVWFFRDTKELNKLFAKRQNACAKLEAAESQILRHAAKAWQSKQSKHDKAKKKKRSKDEESQMAGDMALPEEPSHEFLNQLVPEDKRPKHRTGFLSLFGRKVDTIEYCKAEISRLNPLIAKAQEHIVKGKFLGSVFIRCNLQMGAHVLAQCISHHKPFTMYDKWLEAHPKDIVWENLNDSAIATRGRTAVSWLATVGLIILWFFPVAFVGTLSNFSSLCLKITWLSWVCTAHAPIPGIIQGVLPPLLLVLFFLLIPPIFRVLAWYECIPRKSLISVSVYRRVFIFLFIHGFLIVTLTSGITAAIADIARNPAKTIQALASRLPGASIFFLTYMVSQGWAGAGIALIQLAPLIFYHYRKWFLGRTPRQAYNVTFVMPSADWGDTMPMFSLLAMIAFTYSVISPLINALALISYTSIYVAWKFLIMQVFDQPDEMETGGKYFPMAMTRLFIGLYVEQICLACLFFLKISISRVPSIIDAAMMVALLVITGSAHFIIYNSFRPITNYLPMTLATRKMAKRYEQERKRLHSGGEPVHRNGTYMSRIKSVRKRLAAFPHVIHPDAVPTEPPTETHDDKTQANTDDHSGQAVASGSSARVNNPPNLFRHLSVPDEDKHDQYNRRQNSSGSIPRKEMPDLTRHDSVDSKRSRTSKHSEHRENPNAPAKEADINTDLEDFTDDEESSSQDEADFDEHAFDHPSTYKEQPWIWIPKDTLGLSAILVSDLKMAGVQASDAGAVMDRNGIVEVERSPPDDQWYGGHDR